MRHPVACRAAVAIVAAVAAAGCGTTAATSAARPPARPSAQPSATSSATPSPSPSPTIDYAQQYLADAAPYNSQDDAWVSWSKRNPDATNSEIASAIKPWHDATVTFGRELLQQQWPASAQADIHALAVTVEALASDYDPEAIAAGAFDQVQADHDAATGTGAAQAVRAELGLPPSS